MQFYQSLVFAIYSEKKRENHSSVDCFHTCKQYDFRYKHDLRTTNASKQVMQEKTNSKIVAEITSKDRKITENEITKIETLEDVSSINRIGRQKVFPNNFAPVTLNTSTKEENLKIALLSYDDLEKDSPFSEMQYRLSSGNYIKTRKKVLLSM